jgi:hypothetical protein
MLISNNNKLWLVRVNNHNIPWACCSLTAASEPRQIFIGFWTWHPKTFLLTAFLSAVPCLDWTCQQDLHVRFEGIWFGDRLTRRYFLGTCPRPCRGATQLGLLATRAWSKMIAPKTRNKQKIELRPCTENVEKAPKLNGRRMPWQLRQK